MSTAATIIWGVASSLTAAGLLWLLARAGRLPLFPIFRIGRILRLSGVSGFFPERADYLRLRKGGDIVTYVRTAQHSLTYVGFSLAHGVQSAGIVGAIQELVSRRVKVTLVLLNPDIDGPYRSRLSRYLGVSEMALTTSLRDAYLQFTQLEAGLTGAQREFLSVRVHDELLTSSAFLFDSGSSSAKILVDCKVYGEGRDGSYGIELRGGRNASSLFKRFSRSFQSVQDCSRPASQGVATALTKPTAAPSP